MLLALGFLGLVHALLETTAGKARRRATLPLPGLRGVTVFAATSVVLLLALFAAAFWLPGSELVAALGKGLS